MRSSTYHYATTYLLILTFLTKVNPEKRIKRNNEETQLVFQQLANSEQENDNDDNKIITKLINQHTVLTNNLDDISDNDEADAMSRNHRIDIKKDNNNTNSGFVADNEESSNEELQKTKQKITKIDNKNNRNVAKQSKSASIKSCRSSKAGVEKKICEDDSFEADVEVSDEDDGQEDVRPRKKIKYSIKFAHEKERSKKKKQGIDTSIMRIHKSGKKKSRYSADDDSSEEDDEPFPKKFRFYDDDDDF